jgi:hypothetical protein
MNSQQKSSDIILFQSIHIAKSSKSLADELRSARVEAPVGSFRFFIPRDDLQCVVNPAAIHKEFMNFQLQTGRFTKADLENLVNRRAPKLFTLLVLLGKPALIEDFLAEGIDDSHLPFQKLPNGKDRNHFRLQSNSRHLIRSVACWNHRDVEEFSRNQWMFLAPVFEDRGIPHYELNDNCVLPFINHREGREVHYGGFSSVWAAQIHPAHYNWESV